MRNPVLPRPEQRAPTPAAAAIAAAALFAALIGVMAITRDRDVT